MASVWYLGNSDSRTITGAQWTAAGIGGSPATTTWNSANGWSIDRSLFTQAQLDKLATDANFNTNAADGPRPSAGVSTPDAAKLTKADLVGMGIGPDQINRRFKSLQAEKSVPVTSNPKLGPISTDFTAVTLNVAVGSMGAYTKTYDSTQLQAVAEEGEGNLYTSAATRYAFGPFNSMPHSLRTMCNGDKFSFYTPNDVGAAGFHLYVDGKPTSLTPYLPTAGTPSWQTLTFPSVGTREIEIRTAAGIGGLYTSNPYELWKPPPRRGPRVLIIGDSYTSAAGTTNAMNSLYWNIGPHINCDDVWIDQYGGTGYGVTSAANGTDAPANRYIDRMSPIVLIGQTWDVAAIAPDVVIVHGGGANDMFKGRTTAQAIADATTVLTALRQKLPVAKLIFVEGFAPPGFTPATYNPNYITIRTGVQAACAALGVTYIDVATTIPWIQGTGYNGTGDATKNSYNFISADTYHPNDAGHLYLRRRLAPKIRRIMLDDTTSLEGVLV